MMDHQHAFGWYGKIPCLGDFVRGQLSTHFITAWDEWVQTVLIAGRQRLAERWDTCYFNAPIWRFSLCAGLCGPCGVVGIMMPSVDRVGRMFPLCLALELKTQASAPPPTSAFASAWMAYRAFDPVLEALEEVALAMLEDNVELGHLKAALTTLPAPHSFKTVQMEPLESAGLLVADGTFAHEPPSFSANESCSIWGSHVDADRRIFVTAKMPSTAGQAAVLFDLHARLWEGQK